MPRLREGDDAVIPFATQLTLERLEKENAKLRAQLTDARARIKAARKAVAITHKCWMSRDEPAFGLGLAVVEESLRRPTKKGKR